MGLRTWALEQNPAPKPEFSNISYVTLYKYFSYQKYLLSAYHIPHISLCPGDTMIQKTDGPESQAEFSVVIHFIFQPL